MLCQTAFTYEQLNLKSLGKIEREKVRKISKKKSNNRLSNVILSRCATQELRSRRLPIHTNKKAAV